MFKRRITLNKKKTEIVSMFNYMKKNVWKYLNKILS